MPWGDGTGPTGQGPMTGRGAGYCAGYNMPGYMNPMPVRGFGRGFGRGKGMGLRRGFGFRKFGFMPAPIAQPYPEQLYPQPYQPTKEEERKMLEDEAKAVEEEQKALKQELEAIKKRIKELESKK
ncbi:DUF5320 domain-containing protein [Candidatus Woesearchaeota archaeon]|nr:DUF5320 domain-containing protein [Candidatus Woesearchaeota archaeon]